jgi:uncharacterized protein (DUF58 family)
MARRHTALTMRGGCVLTAGLAAAACAAVLDERDILRIAVFAVVMPVLALLYARLLRAGVSAHRELPPERVTVGEDALVRIRVEVRGGIPGGGLDLQESLPRVLGASPRFHLNAPTRRAAAGYPLDYTVPRLVRGVHHLGPLWLSAGDPLGLARSSARVGQTSPLLAVPAVTALPPGTPRGGAGNHPGAAASAPVGTGEPDVIVREYRHGDDARKVHWRSTARRDELMVRTEEPPAGVPTTVLLDHRASAHRGSAAASLEWAVSFAASVCAHVGQSGQRYRLIGADGTVLADEASTGGQHGRELVLDCLARLGGSPERVLRCPPEPGRRLIAVLGACRPADAEALASCPSGGAAGVAVLLNGDAPRRRTREAGHWEAGSVLGDAGWTVVHAGAGNDPARVWAKLLARSAPETTAPGWRG